MNEAHAIPLNIQAYLAKWIRLSTSIFTTLHQSLTSATLLGGIIDVFNLALSYDL
jgi:hypothetical protein